MSWGYTEAFNIKKWNKKYTNILLYLLIVIINKLQLFEKKRKVCGCMIIDHGYYEIVKSVLVQPGAIQSHTVS